jgi:hypothetical protein
MCDQSAEHGVGVLNVAEVTGAVECVHARRGRAGHVANVVQPRGGFQEIGVSAENRCQAACPRSDASDVGPAAGERHLEECQGEMFSPEASAFMQPGQTASAGRSRTWHAVETSCKDHALPSGNAS